MCYSQTKFSYSEQSTTPTIRATGGLIRWIWSTATFLCFSSAYAQIDFAQLVKAPNSHNTQALQAEIAGYTGQSGQSTMLLPNGQHPTMRELSPTRTVVFLSRSMPETALIHLLKQGAGRKDVVFAFRGWGDGPVTDMFKYSKTLLGKLPAQARKKPPQVIVMPAAFREYRIHYVPAVLHHDNDNKWYLLQGAQSLDGAIDTIRARRFNERVSRQYRVSEPDQAVVMEQKMKRQDVRPHIHAAQQSARKLLEGTVTLPANTEYRRYNYAPFVASTSDIVNPRDGKVLYPKGTRFNVLALDPQGKRAMAVIDGRSRWQVEFARHLVANKPDTLVLYTKLGYLANAGIPASPLDAAMKGRLKVTGVPTYYRQNGMVFNVVAVREGKR